MSVVKQGRKMNEPIRGLEQHISVTKHISSRWDPLSQELTKDGEAQQVVFFLSLSEYYYYYYYYI